METNNNELFLVVSAGHYDHIIEGSKNKEFRDFSRFWIQRIWNGKPKTVRFQRGYTKAQARFKIVRITLANRSYEEYPLKPVVPNGFEPAYFVIWIGNRID